MELTPEKTAVVVLLAYPYYDRPLWFRRVAAHVIHNIPNWKQLSHEVLYAELYSWLELHYAVTWYRGDETLTLTFPNEETYLQCLLTWS